MRKTLIIYESNYGTSVKVANITALIIGSAKVCSIDGINEELNNYDNLVLIYGFHGYDTANKIKKYLSINKSKINCKRIGIIGVGVWKKDIIHYSNDICSSMDRKADIIEFVLGELNVDRLTDKDKKVLKEFLNDWGISFQNMGGFKESNVFPVAKRCSEVLNRTNTKLNRDQLFDEIKKFILSHNTCALATGNGKWIRCTPIEYIYYKEAFYFITEGGLKFVGLLENPKVSIAIYDNYTSMKVLKGMQISGKAKRINIDEDEYYEVMLKKGVNKKSIEKIPFTMNLIKVVPEKYEFTNSDFKFMGVGLKQVLIVQNKDK